MKDYKQASNDAKRYIEGRMSGDIRSLKTPWPTLNKAGIDGLEWGTVNIIGAMSGVGKTALMNELVFAVDDLNPFDDIAVCFFTMEMAAARIIERMISRELGIAVKDIHTSGEETLKKIKENIIPKHDKLDIRFVEKMYTIGKIKEIIQAFCSKRLDKKCLIVYDHSLLVRRLPKQTERDALVNFGKELLMLKKQFPNSQYMILSQLNRAIEMPERIRNKQLHYPMKSDIFGSDSLWQASDTALVMHDPHRLNIVEYGPLRFPTKGVLFGHLLKVREGRLGMFVVKNEAKFNRFPQLTKAEKIAYGFYKK